MKAIAKNQHRHSNPRSSASEAVAVANFSQFIFQANLSAPESSAKPVDSSKPEKRSEDIAEEKPKGWRSGD
jgi:hypothetical protein